MIIGCGSPRERSAPAVLVAAASDLAKAGGALATAFERSRGWKVAFSFGASGQLEQQIRQGAPFDVYAPAARSFCQSLQRDGFIEGECKVFALGRLVAWSRSLELKSLEELRQDQIRRVAMANPRFAPYGRAAQQALQSAGLWDALQPKLIYADSVAHAFQMAETGNVEVALVARALVSDTGGPFYLIEPNLYPPIEQPAAVLRASENPQAAGAFLEFLSSPEGQRVLEDYGFEMPEKAPSPR